VAWWDSVTRTQLGRLVTQVFFFLFPPSFAFSLAFSVSLSLPMCVCPFLSLSLCVVSLMHSQTEPYKVQFSNRCSVLGFVERNKVHILNPYNHEKEHQEVSLFLSLSVCLSVSLSVCVCLSVCLSLCAWEELPTHIHTAHGHIQIELKEDAYATGLAFAPNGKKLYVGTHTHTIHIKRQVGNNVGHRHFRGHPRIWGNGSSFFTRTLHTFYSKKCWQMGRRAL